MTNIITELAKTIDELAEKNATLQRQLDRATRRYKDAEFELNELYSDMGWCDELQAELEEAERTRLGYARDLVQALMTLAIVTNDRQIMAMLKAHDIRHYTKQINNARRVAGDNKQGE